MRLVVGLANCGAVWCAYNAVVVVVDAVVAVVVFVVGVDGVSAGEK